MMRLNMSYSWTAAALHRHGQFAVQWPPTRLPRHDGSFIILRQSCYEIRGDGGKLLVGGQQIVRDFGGDDVGVGEIVGIFEAFVLSQKILRLSLSRLRRSSS